MSSNICGFLGLLRRAGKITIGCDPVCDSVAQGKSSVVLMAADISANTKKSVIKRTRAYSPHIYIMTGCSKEELSHALGRQTAVLSVDDEKAGEAALHKLADDKEECHYDDEI